MLKIKDFISGKLIKADPEEIEAVQPFSKILVEDYNYPKEFIITRPQYRVSIRPSDSKKSYPVDIAIFNSRDKRDEDLSIIVECKQTNRKDGIKQLQKYLTFSDAELGVWFNGNERLFYQKYESKGKVYFKEIPNIPKFGEKINEIGLYKRKDLKKTHNLIQVFKTIRNYLAGNAVNTTRDEQFAREIINIILTKLYDEKFTKPEDIVNFRAGINENSKEISDRIKIRFNETKKIYKDVLDDNDKIELDDKSISYIVGELQNYCLLDCDRDVIGDAFEVFIHGALKGGQGQFFTPRNVVLSTIKIINPDQNDKIIDPACGSGGFLVEALRHVHKKIEDNGSKLGWPKSEIDAEKISRINSNFRGIEKDGFLGKVAKAYMVLLGDGKSGVYPGEDSLNNPKDWSLKTRNGIQLNSFDLVLTNPPFGAKIKVEGEDKLKQYDLAFKFEREKNNNEWFKTNKLKKEEAPQVLFIDRCLQLLKDGGRMGIVLPDGILSNPTDGYIVDYLLQNSEIIGLIDMPMSTFLPKTPTKCHLLFLKKVKNPRTNYDIFMSYAYTCGHDKRGKKINLDEISLIPEHLEKLKNKKIKSSHLGFFVNAKDIKNNILLPKFYNPDLNNDLKDYEKTGKFENIKISDLINNKIIELSRGNEVGSDNYGTGDVPFIRTSEVANWEIIADPTHCLSVEVYNQYKDRQDIQSEDILVVNDGTYLMGRSAMITELDTKIVYQSHFRKLRVLNKNYISPYTLLGLLGLEIVQKQIEAKSFRQGTISTLGSRLKDIIIPIPKDLKLKEKMHNEIKEIIDQKKQGKKISQSFKLLEKNENLMGIKNKAKIGNL